MNDNNKSIPGNSVGFMGKLVETPTSRFLKSCNTAVIDKIFDVLLDLLTNDRWLGVSCRVHNSIVNKLMLKFLDSICVKIEMDFGITAELRKAMFGIKGMSGKKSALAYFLFPILDKYLHSWKKRQEFKVQVPGFKRKRTKINNLWKGWKALRDEICPNFSVNTRLKLNGTIKILPDDVLTPKERINNLVEFKDVDRVGFGPTLSGHAICFIGAQPRYDIGGLWQSCCGPGAKMAKATINAWIRIGGLDFFPTSIFPLANPIPEVHSPFYFKWAPPPSDTNYEQFIEQELLKNYQQIKDWGLSSLAQEVTKSVMRIAIIGVKELIIADSIIKGYFGKEFFRFFESYAGSIAAIWDVIPMARSFIPFMKDLKRRADEIQQIFEFLEPGMTELAIFIAKLTKQKYVLVGNSRGSNSWISKRMFEEIFWPSQKRTCEKIIKAGFKICAHLDNDWTENMELMLELPKHSGFFHLDTSDLPKVRKIIGDHFCLMGNLHPAITTGASPNVVYKKTKELIETCGKEGGYIVATGCEPPANIPIHNYYAMKRAIKDFGYFRK
ncbi:MAG: uroporphyrinogen decarboxylase family protein [Promethearchaeota archaeon]